MTEMNMVEAIRDTLAAEMERDERVIVLGQDVGRLGGVFRATDGLEERFGEERVVDMPLAEGAIAGSAVGLAISGLVPVAEMQFLGFAAQAFHQIEGQVARMRYRSGGGLAMPIVIRAPFGGNVRTPELHSDSQEARYVQAPGIKVVAPATAADAKGLLTQAVRDQDPVLYLEPLAGYRLQRDDVPEGEHTVPFGKLRTVREGADVTVVAWSAAVRVAEAAADLAAAEGISCSVVDLRTLVPLDEDGLAEAVARTGRAVVVHEAPCSAGFGAEVIATVQEHAFWSLKAPMARVTAPDTPYPIGRLEEHYVPSATRVLAAIRRTAEAG
ncbi:MAG: alpha-ketoacid dehydrogenase subunit beta [Thermoleophilia bacterium]|nr:alpha-ketoacid dehydrogenase subunit beta [Thermoleophilia bacterium]